MTATATRLWALDAPRFTVDSSFLVVGTIGAIEIRISAYLIEHPKGLVLFDSQCMPKAIDEGPEAAYGGLADVINMVSTPEMRLDRQIEALGFTVFSRGLYAQDQGPRGKVIDFRSAIEIEGVRIEPGALLFGDREGVLVIPREAEDEAIRRSLAKATTEGEVGRAIRAGMSTVEAWNKFGVM